MKAWRSSLAMLAIAGLLGAAGAGAGGGSGDISVAPASLSLGPVLADTLAVDTLVVTNDGTGPLTFGEILADHPAFDAGSRTPVLPPGATLAAGSSVRLPVSFRSAAQGTTTATLTIPTDDPDEPEVLVPLRGVVVGPPVIGVSPDSLSEILGAGATLTRQLVLDNTGVSDLRWTLSIVPATGGTPLRSGLEGVHILWDRTHGQNGTTGWRTIVDSLVALGATVDEITGPAGTLTPQLLGDYRLYWSIDVLAHWTAAECAALATWTTNGGGVLLAGDNLASVARYDSLLASLGSTVRWSGTGTSQSVTTDIHAHPVTQGVTSMWVGVGARTLTVGSPADTLVDDLAGPPVAAVEEIGIGRVVTLSDELFDDVAIQTAESYGAGNQRFGHQAIDWLVGATWLTTPTPTGTVPAGGSTSVDLVFDTAGLAGGTFDLNVRVSSNDPLTPVVDVPVRLVLTGVPDIAVAPASVDFGPVAVSRIGTGSLAVHNVGQDTLHVAQLSFGTPSFAAVPTTFSVLPADSLPVTLYFVPDSVGLFADTLTIASDDPDEPSVTVPFAGEGRTDCSAPCAPPSLRPADAQGSPGFLFPVDVEVEQNAVPIGSFGFTLAYDDSLLDFADSADAGFLTPGFVVSAQRNQPGRVTAGGFGLTPVPAGSSGSIVRLFFQVACDTCIGAVSDLVLGELTNDVAALNACCGTFTLTQCPNGTGDVNADGALTPQDALCALKIYLNGGTLPPDADCDGNGNCEVESADADCDGTVTPGDALAIYAAWQAGQSPSTCLGAGGSPRGGTVLRWGTPGPDAGGGVSVPIVADGAAPAAFGLDVRFDPARWRWRGVTEGPAVGYTWLEATVDAGGTVRVAGIAPRELSPGGDVARLAFEPAGEGDPEIVLSAAADVAFAGPAGVRPGVEAGAGVTEGLEGVGPVPATSRLEVTWSVAREGASVELGVLDVGGRVVRTLATGTVPAGRHRREWDGRDESGRPAAAGIYFVRLRVGERTWTRKAVLVR